MTTTDRSSVVESSKSEVSKIKVGPRRRRWPIYAAGALAFLLFAALGSYALAADPSPPPLNHVNAGGETPPGPGVVVNKGAGPHLLEVTSAGMPQSVGSVPPSIPAAGVLVNNDFELFPLVTASGSASPSGVASPAATAVTSQGALNAAEAYIHVTNAISVSTVQATFTFPASISGPGQSTAHQLKDIPSWIVDWSVSPTQLQPSAPINGPAPSNLPTVANVVVAIDASTGDAYFSTFTP